MKLNLKSLDSGWVQNRMIDNETDWKAQTIYRNLSYLKLEEEQKRIQSGRYS